MSGPFTSMKRLLQSLLPYFFIILSLACQSAYSIIWSGQNDWNIEWENKYSSWISDVTHDPNFFLKRNIKTDCADAAYSFRWIFSRINNLKAAVKINTHTFFTNESNRFDQLPTNEDWEQDERFLKALDFVSSNFTKAEFTYQDTYPVEINNNSLVPGTMFIQVIKRQHVQLISRSSTENDHLPIGFVQSTTPRKLQSLITVDYWDGSQPTDHREGFMKFRWPIKKNGKWAYVPSEKMPYYSLHQYDPTLLNNWEFPFVQKDGQTISTLPTFTTYLFFTLNPSLNPISAIHRGFEEIYRKFKKRIEYVDNGYEFCRARSNGCPVGSPEYEDWSTPSRDKQLSELIGQVALDIGNIRGIVENPQTEWNNFMYNTTIFKWNDIDVKAIHLYIIWRYELYSSDPNATPEERWGLNKLDFNNFKPKAP